MAKAKAARKSDQFQEGDRVTFLSSHNKALELVGKIVKIHEESDLLDIEADVDGKIIEVEGHVQTISAADVKAAGEGAKHRHVGDRS